MARLLAEVKVSRWSSPRTRRRRARVPSALSGSLCVILWTSLRKASYGYGSGNGNEYEVYSHLEADKSTAQLTYCGNVSGASRGGSSEDDIQRIYVSC